MLTTLRPRLYFTELALARNLSPLRTPYYVPGINAGRTQLISASTPVSACPRLPSREARPLHSLILPLFVSTVCDKLSFILVIDQNSSSKTTVLFHSFVRPTGLDRHSDPANSSNFHIWNVLQHARVLHCPDIESSGALRLLRVGKIVNSSLEPHTFYV
jgi:hypothetical protein